LVVGNVGEEHFKIIEVKGVVAEDGVAHDWVSPVGQGGAKTVRGLLSAFCTIVSEISGPKSTG
jgi:hypothetical protein